MPTMNEIFNKQFNAQCNKQCNKGIFNSRPYAEFDEKNVEYAREQFDQTAYENALLSRLDDMAIGIAIDIDCFMEEDQNE